MKTLSPEAAALERIALERIALERYNDDGGELYETSDSADFEAMVAKHGSADAAWNAHLVLLSARREVGGYYEVF